jgi:hypothetical protein
MMIAMLSICSKEELSDEGVPQDGKEFESRQKDKLLQFNTNRIRGQKADCAKQNQGYWQNVQSLWHAPVCDSSVNVCLLKPYN